MKKSVSNRIKVTPTGKVLRRKMGASHFRAKKSGNQKRSLRGFVTMHPVDVRAMEKNVKQARTTLAI